MLSMLAAIELAYDRTQERSSWDARGLWSFDLRLTGGSPAEPSSKRNDRLSTTIETLAKLVREILVGSLYAASMMLLGIRLWLRLDPRPSETRRTGRTAAPHLVEVP